MSVYIMENVEASLVKVGITMNSDERRRVEVNQLWLGTQGTCQVCAVRLHVKRINRRKLIPKHPKYGVSCIGSYALPLEKDSTLAREHLMGLKANLKDLTGSKKGSLTRKVNKLDERIKRFEGFDRLEGIWRVNTVYYTANPEAVESLAHKILSKYLVSNVPLGEVFRCSVDEARKAIDLALHQLDLSGSARVEFVDEDKNI